MPNIKTSVNVHSQGNLLLLRASHMLPFVQGLEKINAPVNALLSKAGLSIEQLTNPENLIPEHGAWLFIELAQQYTKRDDFGFWITEHQQLDAYGRFGEYILAQNNLYLALLQFIDTMDSQTSSPKFWLQESKDVLWFCRQGPKEIKVGTWPVEQHVLAIMIQLVRFYLGNNWSPAEVKVQVNQPTGCHKTQFLTGSMIKPAQAYTAIAISKKHLVSDNLHDLQGQRKVAKIAKSDTENLSVLLQQSYFGEEFTLDDIAEKFSIHVRKLQRILRQENTSFRQLVEAFKYSRARHLLERSGLTITEIALELGFANLPNFSRAFKKWHGSSPDSYRKKINRAL